MSNLPCGLEKVNDFKEKTFEVFLMIELKNVKRDFFRGQTPAVFLLH